MNQRLLLLLSICLAWTCSSQAGEYSVYPMIHFQRASTYVRANETCIHDDVILHKEKDVKKVTYCDDNGSNCVTVEKPLVQPIASINWRCDKDVCDDDERIPYDYVQGLKLKIKIYRSKEDAVSDKDLKKVIPYKLDKCPSI